MRSKPCTRVRARCRLGRFDDGGSSHETRRLDGVGFFPRPFGTIVAEKFARGRKNRFACERRGVPSRRRTLVRLDGRGFGAPKYCLSLDETLVLVSGSAASLCCKKIDRVEANYWSFSPVAASSSAVQWPRSAAIGHGGLRSSRLASKIIFGFRFGRPSQTFLPLSFFFFPSGETDRSLDGGGERGTHTQSRRRHRRLDRGGTPPTTTAATRSDDRETCAVRARLRMVPIDRQFTLRRASSPRVVVGIKIAMVMMLKITMRKTRTSANGEAALDE